MNKPTPRNPGRPVDASQARPSAAKGGELMSKEAVQLPDYIKESKQARGSENVSTGDLTIPRIEVAQALSKCLKESEPGYIEGAKQGDLYNSLTRQLYGSSAVIVPVFFKREFLIWVDRKARGASGTNGFRGAFQTEEEALRAKKVMDDADKLMVAETHQQFVLIVRGQEIDEVVVSLSRSKLKVSRNFNSLIRLNGNDRFSRAYRLGTVEETNDKGDFWNFQIANHGFPSREAYEKAERLYEMIAAGRADVDRTYDADLDGAGDHAAEM